VTLSKALTPAVSARVIFSPRRMPDRYLTLVWFRLRVGEMDPRVKPRIKSGDAGDGQRGG
jgi:hypothetical protein